MIRDIYCWAAMGKLEGTSYSKKGRWKLLSYIYRTRDELIKAYGSTWKRYRKRGVVKAVQVKVSVLVDRLMDKDKKQTKLESF
jgi:hypothetical protein